MRRIEESWQEPISRAQLWLGALGFCVTLIGVIGTFVVTTRETALRLEWRVQQTERLLTEVQAAKELQRLSLELRTQQNALRGLEIEIIRLRRER